MVAHHCCVTRYRRRAAVGDPCPAGQPCHIDFANASSFGIAPDRLVADDDYSDCQDLASQLRQEGRAGMVVPNAAFAGTRSVVLFGPFVLTGYANPAPDPEQLPGALLADHSGPGSLARGNAILDR